MRIISGKYKSLNIDVPSGRDVRPTTDRVREAMFSSVESLIGSINNKIVLDAFAGSGALGIESISRGAKHVVFCEKDFNIKKNLKSNLDKLNIAADMYEILKTDSFSAAFVNRLQNIHNKIDLVFLDPPYAVERQSVFEFIESIENILSEDVLIVYEHANNSDDTCDLKGFNIVKSKTYGTISIDYIRRS